MQDVKPEVLLIAKPQIDWDMVEMYLDSIGGGEWFRRMNGEDRGVTDAEALIEFAGRGCYRSWDVGLNKNVTKVRGDSESYIDNLLKSEHGSVLEHAQFTFVFKDVSRIFTHELVRHRVGVAISQESMRYVRLDDVPMWFPDELATDKEFMSRAKNICHMYEVFMGWATRYYKLDDPGMSFERKKAITSALRRLAPSGHATMVTWSANVRTLRHTIMMRTAIGAEAEMRLVFDEIARIMKAECPLLFKDLEVNIDTGAWERV